MATPLVGINAAEALSGHQLESGWTVTDRVTQGPRATGGNFSINYWATGPSGQRGFCKVLNYWWLLQSLTSGGDPVSALAEATAVYQFERDLALECVNLSRVITAVDHGSFFLPGYAQPTVSYIIFEVAETDIRQMLNTVDALDVAARLRAIHHLATGIRQLHSRSIAHQDVKPSNTLVFAADASGDRLTKVGDLGRATAAGRPAAHDDYAIAGDPNYAPVEALYGFVPSDFTRRRIACDLYQLGSMISFVFTASTMNALFWLELHPSANWENWGGSYGGVLPFLQDAFGRIIVRVSAEVPTSISDRIARLVRSLCNPDVDERGWFPSRFTGVQYSLDRVISEIDLLAKRAAIAARSTA